MNENKNIWLIDLGDEITWCDTPDPSDGIDEDDVTGYVRADIHGKLEQANKKLIEERDTWRRRYYDLENAALKIDAELKAEQAEKE